MGLVHALRERDRGGDLVGANLTEANLYSNTLSGAILAGADLTSSNLNAAVLSGAILANANLTDALCSATLAGANLTGAVITRADFGNTTSKGFTREQLYSTQTYQDGKQPGDLGYVRRRKEMHG